LPLHFSIYITVALHFDLCFITRRYELTFLWIYYFFMVCMFSPNFSSTDLKILSLIFQAVQIAWMKLNCPKQLRTGRVKRSTPAGFNWPLHINILASVRSEVFTAVTMLLLFTFHITPIINTRFMLIYTMFPFTLSIVTSKNTWADFNHYYLLALRSNGYLPVFIGAGNCDASTVSLVGSVIVKSNCCHSIQHTR
jgi:hypothetical protein